MKKENENEKKFVIQLKTFAPELHFIYEQCKQDFRVARELMDIIQKMWLVKNCDDGFGKVVVEMQKGRVFRVRMIQDKIIKQLNDEKEI